MIDSIVSLGKSSVFSCRKRSSCRAEPDFVLRGNQREYLRARKKIKNARTFLCYVIFSIAVQYTHNISVVSYIIYGLDHSFNCLQNDHLNEN